MEGNISFVWHQSLSDYIRPYSRRVAWNTKKFIKNSYGTRWYNEFGELHREDGPAVEWDDGRKEWFQNDERHRIDGPAIYNYNNKAYFYIRSINFKDKEHWFRCLKPEEKYYAMFNIDEWKDL